MKRYFPLVFLAFILILGSLIAQEPPQTEISNGLIHAKLYLPDAEKGFYRGTRFEWSGIISSLEYKDHDYIAKWFTKYDPAVRDVEYDPATDGFAAGTSSASLGPIQEFSTVLGYDEAKAGETFVKVGVGGLRKPEEARYTSYTRYEIVNPGKWTVKRGPDRVAFVQELTDASGYGYVYRKIVRLAENKPVLVLEHSLRNTGRLPIATVVYDHNFFVMDNRPSGPEFVMRFPFAIQGSRDMKGLAEARGNELVFLRELEKAETAFTPVRGYGDSAKDYDIRIENRKTGAGVRITGDRPLARVMFWSIRSTRCPEPFVDVRIEPGGEFTWNISYEFYALP